MLNKIKYTQYFSFKLCALMDTTNVNMCAKGVITPNQIPLTTIVTYLQKSYRSRISNHLTTIPACSVVPTIYKQSKKTYCPILATYRKFTVATVRFTQNVSCNIYTHPVYQQVSNDTVIIHQTIKATEYLG